MATLMPYDSPAMAVDLVARGGGENVASVYTDDRENLAAWVDGIAPYTGRLLVIGRKTTEGAIGPGVVLPTCVHGGPGRSGGGEELGWLRGLELYMQRTAIQGDRAVPDRVLGLAEAQDTNR